MPIKNVYGAICLIFGIFRRDPNDFLSRLFTMEETWLYHHDPETKQQPMEWRNSGSPRPKIFRVQKSAGNILTSIFWDHDGILLIDYLPKGQTIDALYYSSLLVQLKDILKVKQSGKVTKCALFLQENVPAHQALATQKKLAYLDIQCLYHPPYSQDLTTSEHHLFPGLKKNRNFAIFRPTLRSLLPRRPGWTDNLPNFSLSIFQTFEQVAKKCTELREEYVE